MIHSIKRQIRHWVAVQFGELQTAEEEYVCEFICPQCDMTTTIDITKNEKQPCYFCGESFLDKQGASASASQTQETLLCQETPQENQPNAHNTTVNNSMEQQAATAK